MDGGARDHALFGRKLPEERDSTGALIQDLRGSAADYLATLSVNMAMAFAPESFAMSITSTA